MVQNYIIDQAQERARKVRREQARPRLEMPRHNPDEQPQQPSEQESSEDGESTPSPRGVFIIDY